MFPCLRGGFGEDLSRRARSDWITFARVSRGSMTSSMYPAEAAKNGLLKRAR